MKVELNIITLTHIRLSTLSRSLSYMNTKGTPGNRNTIWFLLCGSHPFPKMVLQDTSIKTLPFRRVAPIGRIQRSWYVKHNLRHLSLTVCKEWSLMTRSKLTVCKEWSLMTRSKLTVCKEWSLMTRSKLIVFNHIHHILFTFHNQYIHP